MATPCSVPDCSNPIKGRGLCNMHLARLRRTGTTELAQRPRRACSVDGCDRPYRSGGYCGMHYSRLRATGHPGPAAPHLAPANQTCAVDRCDRPARHHGVCRLHHIRAQREAEVATDPSRRINAWATNDQRLRRTGWTEHTVVPGLGPCWEWAGPKDRKGYGRVSAQGRKMRAAHRVAYQEWVGPIADTEEVCHRCDNPPCIRPSHLFPGSRQDNITDAVTKDRHAYGERQGAHKLTEPEVITIRERFVSEPLVYAELAEAYGVSRQTIINVVKGKTWVRAGGPISPGPHNDRAGLRRSTRTAG